MKFKKVLETTLSEMALGDIINAVIISSDMEGVGDDFADYYLKTLRERGFTQKEQIKRHINNDIKKIKEHLDGKKVPTLERIDEKDLEKVLKHLKSKREGLRSDKKKGKRVSNEKAVNKIITDITTERSIPVKTFDTKGTAIDRNFISELKRDQVITLEGGQKFVFETKKASPKGLASPKGILFAEVHKAFTNLTKEQIQQEIQDSPAFKSKFEAHNRNVNKLFTAEVLNQINSEMNNADKPYLIVGNKPDANSIFVVFPDQYYLYATKVDFANVLRIGIYARLKDGVSLNDLRSLRDFFDEMVVENSLKHVRRNLMKEAMSLEKAFDNPAALWVQGLSDKEYSKLLKIIFSGMDGRYVRKKLAKNFEEMQNPTMLDEFENFIRDFIFRSFDNKYVYDTKDFEPNFTRLGIEAGAKNNKGQTHTQAIKSYLDSIRK